MRVAGRAVAVCLAALLWALAPVSAWGQATSQVHSILILDSHSQNDGLSKRLNEGVQQSLARLGEVTRYEHFNLYVSNQPGIQPSPQDVEYLQERLDSGVYDLVILVNNAAVNLFLEHRLKAPPHLPLLVMSYYGPLAERSKMAGVRLTGVETPFTSPDNIRLAMRLMPRARRIVLVGSAQYDPLLPRLIPSEELAERKVEYELLDGKRYSTLEMLERVSRLPEDSVLIYQSWGSAKESPQNNYATLPLIRQRFRGLILSPIFSNIEQGAAGGYLVNGHEQGRMAGRIAMRLLNGERVESIPIEKGETLLELDYPTLLAGGVSLSDVPPEVRLLREPPGWWESHSRTLWLSLLALLAALALLLGVIVARQQLLQKLRLLIGHLPLRIAIVARDGHNLFCHVPDGDLLCGRGGACGGRCCPVPECGLMRGKLDEARRTGVMVSADYECCGRHRQARFIPLGRSLAFGNGSILAISFDTQEISEARRRSAQLAEQLRWTLKSIGDSVVVTDCGGLVTLINEAAATMVGVPVEEAVGRSLDGMLHLEPMRGGADAVASPVRRALASQGGEGPQNERADLLSAGGVRRHIQYGASPIQDPGGEIHGAVLVFRDMTAEFDREDELRRDDLIRQQAMRLGNCVAVKMDRLGRCAFRGSSPGFWPCREDGSLLSPQEWVAKEDLAEFETMLAELRGGQRDACRLMFAAGPDDESRRYFNLSFERLDGSACGHHEFCGVLQDITELRRERLRHGDSQSLLNHILENLPVSVFLKDADHDFRYVMCNRGHQEVTGVAWDMIRGHTDDEFFPQDSPMLEQIHRMDRQVVETGEMYVDDVRCANSAGQTVWLHTIKLPMTLPSGARMLLGMHLDTTRQHELEEARQRAFDNLNRYVVSTGFVNSLLTRALETQDFAGDARDCLRLLGEHFGADRSFIFRYLDDRQAFSSCVYAWGADGAELDFMGDQPFSMALLPGWNERIATEEGIVIDDMDHLPQGLADMEAFVRQKQTRSLLVAGIHVNGRLYGYMGIDYIRCAHPFSDIDRQLMRTCANVFGLVLTRQQQWQSLRDSEAFLRQVIDSISMPLSIMDRDLRIILANPSAAAQNGMTSPDRLIGQRCSELICGKALPGESCPVEQTLKDQKPHTMQNVHDGSKTIITMSQPLFDSNGQMKYVLALDIDITMQEQQRQVLSKALEQAQAASRAKSTFLATISHELRTPLNVVIGYSDVMMNRQLSAAEQIEYLRSINFAGNALLELINDVLDLSKLEADRMVLLPKYISLSRLVGAVVGTFELQAQQKRLQFSSRCYGLEHRLLYLDEARVRQVIFNLVGNAMKFTVEGSVRIRVSFAPHGHDTRGTLLLSVADTGPGISPEQRERIFEPFVQDASARRNGGMEGTGLGLSISRRLIEQMKGHLSLESELEKGSVFTVEIPDVPYMDNLEEPDRTPAPEAPAPLAPCRVLVVDDVELNLKVMTAMLKKLGHSCMTVSSAAAALELLDHDHDFDLIFTDLWMPDMNGAELARRLRADARLAHLPVVAVTADVQAGENNQNVFDDILLKPYTGDSVGTAIRQALQRHAQTPRTP